MDKLMSQTLTCNGEVLPSGYPRRLAKLPVHPARHDRLTYTPDEVRHIIDCEVCLGVTRLCSRRLPHYRKMRNV